MKNHSRHELCKSHSCITAILQYFAFSSALLWVHVQICTEQIDMPVVRSSTPHCTPFFWNLEYCDEKIGVKIANFSLLKCQLENFMFFNQLYSIVFVIQLANSYTYHFVQSFHFNMQQTPSIYMYIFYASLLFHFANQPIVLYKMWLGDVYFYFWEGKWTGRYRDERHGLTLCNLWYKTLLLKPVAKYA